MKLYLEPISVEVREGHPLRLRWRQRVYRVRSVIDFWVSQRYWWRREERRVYMRLMIEEGMIMEVYRRGDEWMLSRIFD